MSAVPAAPVTSPVATPAAAPAAPAAATPFQSASLYVGDLHNEVSEVQSYFIVYIVPYF
jgi:hypothetical protein